MIRSKSIFRWLIVLSIMVILCTLLVACGGSGTTHNVITQKPIFISILPATACITCSDLPGQYKFEGNEKDCKKDFLGWVTCSNTRYIATKIEISYYYNGDLQQDYIVNTTITNSSDNSIGYFNLSNQVSQHGAGVYKVRLVVNGDNSNALVDSLTVIQSGEIMDLTFSHTTGNSTAYSAEGPLTIGYQANGTCKDECLEIANKCMTITSIKYLESNTDGLGSSSAALGYQTTDPLLSYPWGQEVQVYFGPLAIGDSFYSRVSTDSGYFLVPDSFHSWTFQAKVSCTNP